MTKLLITLIALTAIASANYTAQHLETDTDGTWTGTTYDDGYQSITYGTDGSVTFN